MNIITRTTPREISPREIGWLAGILDGEGSIVFGKVINKGIKSGYSFFNGIHLVNTNKEMLEKATNLINLICQDINESHSIKQIEMKNKIYNKNSFIKPKNPKEYKTCYQITLRSKECIVKVLETVLPELTEKRKRAEALIKILTHRLMLNKEAKLKGTKAFYDETINNEYFQIWENARRD